MENRKLTESVKLVNVLPAASYAASANTGTYVNIQAYSRLAFVVNIGAVTNAVEFQVVQATSAAGAGVKDVTAKVFTTTGTDDNTIGVIEILPQDIDSANGFVWLTVVATPDTAAAEFSVTAIETTPIYYPVVNTLTFDV